MMMLKKRSFAPYPNMVLRYLEVFLRGVTERVYRTDVYGKETYGRLNSNLSLFSKYDGWVIVLDSCVASTQFSYPLQSRVRYQSVQDTVREMVPT